MSDTPIYDRVAARHQPIADKMVSARKALVERVKAAKDKGMSNPDIAHQEHISESTVRRLLEA